MQTKSKIIQELKSIIYIVIFVLTIRALLIEPFFVPTGSMKATILEGEYVIATKYSYGYSKYSFPGSFNLFQGRLFANQPQRGDVIIMRPPHKMEMMYVKRLIGMPGDKIQILDDVIYINDTPIEHAAVGYFTDEDGNDYVKYKEILPNHVSYFSYKLSQNMQVIYHQYTDPFYIPEGHYFFMGDNRDNSIDSRFDLGFVPFENLVAKIQFILFSTKELMFLPNNSILQNLSRFWIWISSIRLNRIFSNMYT